MATLLQINSSPMAQDDSFSRQLTAEFVERWTRTNPGGTVLIRDLAFTRLRPIDAEWIVAARRTPEPNRTPRQREVLTLSDELIAELRAADEYVFGVAMHNFSIPSVLKLWLDQVTRPGETFSYAGGKAAGLLQNKKATFLVATGGYYEPGTPNEAMNFVEPYLRTVFGLLGVTDTTFITAGGTARAHNGTERGVILEPALQSIEGYFPVTA